MDGEILNRIRDALVHRWKRIGREYDNQARSAALEESQPQAEIIDIAQNLEQIGRDVSLAEQERREMLAIERALTKMAEGSFGICEECDEEIPPRRLMAIPEARLCANCQTYIEKRSRY